MKGMKKILYNTALIVTLAFILPGCAKCISTETSTVQVKVINKYYTPEHSISRYDLNLKTIVIDRNLLFIGLMLSIMVQNLVFMVSLHIRNIQIRLENM